MDRREVLLEKNKSKVSVNKESELAVSLSAKTRLLPYGEIDEKLSLIKLYNDERDACNRYRMIFTVNPICTNILFNAKTEVVRCEGSKDCFVLSSVTSSNIVNGDVPTSYGSPDGFVHINSRIPNNLQAIRDTEYSHKDFFPDENPYVYHCGWDIFNNHMIRNDDFVHISKAVDSTSKGVFNTIMDYARDKDGNIIEEKILYAATGTDNIPVKMHVYQYDNILSMYNAFKNRLDERNGWFGFINPGNVEIDNAEITVQGVTKTISLNKMMNNNKSCELYELYPDESLYSFIPKFNKFRNRLEYNWEYDIVYPYENEYGLLKKIAGTDGVWTEDNTPIKVLSAKKTSSTSGSDFVMFKTMFRHTFKQGDFARLYYYEDGSIKAINRRFKIVKCGDAEGNDADRYFYVRATDMGDRFKFNNKGEVIFTEGSTEPVQFFYKKDVNGYECKYYIRKFKRIKQDGLESEINKLAFGENIYGDRMAQIIFTDDIDVEGLVDNLKRPLSKVYLYMFKTNKGHDLWYKENIYSADTEEFSHCFGDLTSGLNLTPDAPADYNVRKLHNVNFVSQARATDTIPVEYRNGFEYVYEGSCLMQELPKPIQSGLSITTLTDKGEGFVYGDVVEFDPYYYEETVIENIYHRFNTAQRETTNRKYFDIWDDEIKFDDYDRDINQKNTSKSHEVELNQLNVVEVEIDGRKVKKPFPGNIYPEGYFYNPKTEVKLADVSDTISSVTVKQVKYNSGVTLDYLRNERGEIIPDGVDENGQDIYYLHGIFTITTKYDFTKGDIIALYQGSDGKIFYGFVYGITGNTIDIGFDVLPSDMNGLTSGLTSMLTTREYIAPYAAFLPNSKTFVWRELVKPSELPNDSMLFDRPFANGCFYVHQNVNFFLKRQDPRNEYGLLYPENSNSNIKPQTKNFKMYGSGEIDLSTYNTMPSSLNKICY